MTRSSIIRLLLIPFSTVFAGSCYGGEPPYPIFPEPPIPYRSPTDPAEFAIKDASEVSGNKLISEAPFTYFVLHADLLVRADQVFFLYYLQEYPIGGGQSVSRLYFRRSEDGGATFSSERRLRADSGPAIASIALSTDDCGNIVVWEVDSNGPLTIRTSPDSGNTFSEPMTVSGFNRSSDSLDSVLKRSPCNTLIATVMRTTGFPYVRTPLLLVASFPFLDSSFTGIPQPPGAEPSGSAMARTQENALIYAQVNLVGSQSRINFCSAPAPSSPFQPLSSVIGPMQGFTASLLLPFPAR